MELTPKNINRRCHAGCKQVAGYQNSRCSGRTRYRTATAETDAGIRQQSLGATLRPLCATVARFSALEVIHQLVETNVQV